MPGAIEPFTEVGVEPMVRGFLHTPDQANGDALVLTHGAGGNAKMTLLVALAEAFAGGGYTVLRCDLPFRQSRSFGPPRPSEAARDRQGLRNAAEAVRTLVTGRVFLGGQSYGGRQATLLCADEPGLAQGLLLTSYPLHPPGKPTALRTEHFPRLRIPILFVEGTKDPFASVEEMGSAMKLIPAKATILKIEGVGHDLGFKKIGAAGEWPGKILASFREFFA